MAMGGDGMEKYRISSKTLAVLPISKNRTKVYNKS